MHNMTDTIEKIRKHEPAVITPVGMACMMTQILCATRGRLGKRRKSNNWLKMHGKPMRRRGRV